MEGTAAAVGHQGVQSIFTRKLIDFITGMRGVIGPMRMHRYQLSARSAQDIQRSQKRRIVFDHLLFLSIHKPLGKPHAPAAYCVRARKGGVVLDQGDFHHHRA
ncbi:hypothetical protein BLL36_01075 [Pseudomonas cedrina subsp. cedrina]|uniref:Uncharacterized protein n=1 Tax=Pseudomonas cedrina subsp. cedrina TaxID=76762 RepID=A0A1V2KIQ7_PSECE|nr:hypothetical protein BLL36_01075 [Pseudomonas cedrina subsp. cedrina]